MKLVVQRVLNSKVEVDGKVVGKIDKGFMVLCGITHNDTEKEADILARKLCNLRVFEDENGKMNLSIKDVGGELLIISQFTLYADSMSSGNRPSFINAARPEKAEPLYEYFLKKCAENDVHVEKGIFGADMKVSLINDGPVTIILEKENNSEN
jgi:D-tyrosyl-tRNA(Tyr) deacylase